jgi:hypothetical protein
VTIVTKVNNSGRIEPFYYGTMLYCGGVDVRGLEQVGVGVKVGNELWVTDHYGLHARVEVIGGWGVIIVM